jgi:hypothetical protein
MDLGGLCHGLGLGLVHGLGHGHVHVHISTRISTPLEEEEFILTPTLQVRIHFYIAHILYSL